MLTCVLSLRVSTTPFQTLDTAIDFGDNIIILSRGKEYWYRMYNTRGQSTVWSYVVLATFPEPPGTRTPMMYVNNVVLRH